MKNSSLILVLLIGIALNGSSQVVVKVRPVKPKVVLVKPKRPGPNFVWVEAQWKWNTRKGQYVWCKGRWLKNRRGFVYVPGDWQRTTGGHVWVAGRWRRS